MAGPLAATDPKEGSPRVENAARGETAAAADLLDRYPGLGLPQKSNDLLFGEFALLYVRHSPG
jgi:hypothetical protein